MKRCPICKNELFYYENKIDGELCLVERCPECDFYHKQLLENYCDNGDV